MKRKSKEIDNKWDRLTAENKVWLEGFIERLKQIQGDPDGKLNAEKLGRRAGVRGATIIKWTQGSTPNSSTVHRIAKNLGVSEDWLMYGKDNNHQDNAPAANQYTDNNLVEVYKQDAIGSGTFY